MNYLKWKEILVILSFVGALAEGFRLNFKMNQDQGSSQLLSELTNRKTSSTFPSLLIGGPQISQSFLTSSQDPSHKAQSHSFQVQDSSALISCSSPPSNLSVSLLQMCNLCDLDQVFNLSKTNWVEIDMPVQVESALMEAFSVLKAQFPGSIFYMGLKGTTYCFGSDTFAFDYNLLSLASSLKKDFYLFNSSFIALPKTQIVPEYLVMKLERDFERQLLVESQFFLAVKQEHQASVMNGQFVLELSQFLLDTYEQGLTYSGTLKLLQSGIDLPCLLRTPFNANKTSLLNIEMQMVEKNYSLKEFVYTFNKMGIAIDLPVIKGIQDYQSVTIQLAEMKVKFREEEGKIDYTKANLVSFQIHFHLPDFAILPNLYVRQVQGNLNVLMPKEDEDVQSVEVWLGVNGKLTFQNQNYFLHMIIRVTSDGTQKLEQIKLFPELENIYPVEDALNSIAELITVNQHNPIFPQHPPCAFILKELGLSNSSVQMANPLIKLMSSPMKVGKVSSEAMKVFREEGDAQIQSILGVLAQGKLAAVHRLSFKNVFAGNALKEIFNLERLSLRDQQELDSFKVMGLRILMNNEDIGDQMGLLAPGNKFNQQGMQLELDLEVKQFCEANTFCTLLQNTYGSMFVLSMTGQVAQDKNYVGLQTSLSPLQFKTEKVSAHAPALKNVTLNLNIDYQNQNKPDIEVVLKGLLKVPVQQNFNVTFETSIEMDEGENIKVSGVMDQIFGNAFNLNNTINVTQMTLTGSLNSEGQLSLLDISGVSIFGSDCYKIPEMASMFNSSKDSPSFTSQQQQKLVSLINQTFINTANCQTGNIFLRVNISEGAKVSEHSFKGKVHVDSLSHFFRIFYPQIADKIKAVTPAHIREQPFLNNYLELEYESGKVAINGHEIEGAYKFEGLVDFHGLLSQVRIVLDPDKQTYLYFSYLLPSLTMSHGNIKFLSPQDYLESLHSDPSIKAILESFGAPKIEIEIPLEQISIQKTPVKFVLRGVVSLMGGVQQMVTAEIQNSRLNFTLRANPFRGVFGVELKVTSSISNGPLNDNLASFHGQFALDDNIDCIQDSLNQGIKQWYTTGLRYMKEWEERAARVKELNEAYGETLCDPEECPVYQQCKTNLYLKCLQHEMTYECEKYDPICTNLLQKCTKIKKVCSREVYGECLAHVEVCQQWDNICIGYNAQQCSKFRLVKSNSSCAIFDLACEMESQVDASCYSHCSQMKENYEDYVNLVSNYSEILNKTNKIFSPLAKLKKEFEAAEASNTSGPFLKIVNVTMEGLMDLLVKEEATNVTFQIQYQSQVDNQTRYLRSVIDFSSVVMTGENLLPFILQDLALVYAIPQPIATHLSVVIEQLEGNTGLKVANNLATSGQIDTFKMNSGVQNIINQLEQLIQMVHDDDCATSSEEWDAQKKGIEERAQTKQKELLRSQTQSKSFGREVLSLNDLQMSIEQKMNQMMEQQETRRNRQNRAQKGGLQTEKLAEGNMLLSESQLGQLTEFLKSQ